MRALFYTLSQILFVVLTIGILYVGTSFFLSNDQLALEQHTLPDLTLPKLYAEDQGSVQSEDASPPPLRAQHEEVQTILSKNGVLVWTNVNRIINNLQPLENNEALDIVAQTKLEDMFERQYFAHVSPSGEGASDLAKHIGYEFIVIGENLALGKYKDDRALVQAWMDSPGHKANILNIKYTQIGIAVGRGIYEGRETWLAVQTFALPLSACPQKPSVDLVSQIESRKTQLDLYVKELETKKQEIESLPQDHQYNQKAREYNELIRAYNKLLDETKALIAQYNQAIESFNECIR